MKSSNYLIADITKPLPNSERQTYFSKVKQSLMMSALASITLVLSAFAVDAKSFNAANISLNIDNDSFVGTDREYSSGVYIKFNSASSTNLQKDFPYPVEKIAELLPLNEQSYKSWGVTLGQQIWTPTDISMPNEVENDRAYAGYLLLKSHISEFSPVKANKYSITFGEIGPDSFAEQSQKFIHNLIDYPKPMGWDKQIKDKFVAAVTYETSRLISRDTVINSFDTDIAYIGRIQASNLQSEFAFGGVMRFGEQLEQSFGAVGLTPGNYVDANALSKSKAGYFSYIAAEARYRINDYTIEGARPKHLYDVNLQPWQSTISSGFVYYQASWGTSVSLLASTPNFKEDKKHYHAIASLEFFWRF